MLESIRSQHSIPGVIDFQTGNGGLINAVITTPHASGEVYLHGAHVTQYQLAGHEPLLFVSQQSRWAAGKAIRGGVPICFPWFGPLEGRDTAPAHGFARTAEWEVHATRSNDDGSATIILALNATEDPNAFWPHAFAASYAVTIGNMLKLEFTITHQGGEPCLFEEALHTYFAVGDVRKVSVTGLAGTAYLDKTNHGEEVLQGVAPITITSETDRVYLDTTAACIIDDPQLKRVIKNTKRHSNSTVVWNPWIAKAKAMPDFGDDEWPNMLCIETCNVGGSAVRLNPGQTHTMTAEIQCLSKD